MAALAQGSGVDRKSTPFRASHVREIRDAPHIDRYCEAFTDGGSTWNFSRQKA